MRVIFRVDSSVDIGNGHVMRCLTIADEISKKGGECYFICREHPGHITSVIESHGHDVFCLTARKKTKETNEYLSGYSHWLGVETEVDADETRSIIKTLNPDWLIIDHYGIDSRWEELSILSDRTKTMVIDDLANRNHLCHLLIDQTLGRDATAYSELVPADSSILAGSDYIILKPEYKLFRGKSQNKQIELQKNIKKILISMGGVDKLNITGKVLDLLKNTQLPDEIEIIVILGKNAPFINEIRDQSEYFPRKITLKVAVEDMASVLSEVDVAIGAPGTSAWERCCLGIPTLMVIVAENQIHSAAALVKQGAAEIVFDATKSALSTWEKLPSDAFCISKLKAQSKRAFEVTDGLGVHRIVTQMEKLCDG